MKQPTILRAAAASLAVLISAGMTLAQTTPAKPEAAPPAANWNSQVTAGAESAPAADAKKVQPAAAPAAPAKSDQGKAEPAKTAPVKTEAPAAKPATAAAPAAAPIETGAVPQPAAAPAAPPAAPTAIQPVVFGDWVIDCQAATPKPICMLRQFVGDDRQRRIIEFRAMVAGGQPLLEVWVPVGISIPYGVTVDVSDAKKLPAQLVDCIQTGCRAVMALNAANLADIKSAQSLAVTFQDSKSGKVITISGSPKGFEGGIASVLN